MIFKDINWASLLNKKSTYLYLLAIICGAVFLRIYLLDFKSLWIDELYTIVPTNPSKYNDFFWIVNHCKSDQPPFFFLLLHYWFFLVPYTPFFGRLLCAIFGVMGVFSMFFLGKEIKSERVGLFSSLLVAVNHFHIAYSQELRFYSLLYLLTVLSFLFFIRSLKYRNRSSYVLYVLSTIALLYTQYYGMLIFAIQGFIFLIYVIVNKEKISFILTGVMLAVIIGASFLPWLPTILYDNQISSFWITKPKPYFFATYYYIYWGRDMFTAKILLIVSFLYVLYLIKAYRSKSLSSVEIYIAFLLTSWIVLSLAIPYVRSILSTPVLIPRYTIVTLPAIILVTALGMDLIKKNSIRLIVTVVIVCAAVFNIFFVLKHYTTHDKAQWREAAQAVIDNHEPNVKVYSNLQWWYNYYFYFTEPHIIVQGRYTTLNKEDELQIFITEMGSEKQFWVLNGEGVPGLTDLQQNYVNKHFKVVKQYKYFAASAILYKARK